MFAKADVILLGRSTCKMMKPYWRAWRVRVA
jgi:hypothetical protein